ncbi:MAG: sugar phosphate isomerase/epimerase family protein [Nostoc sp. SerVER01]|nr:sugar phosphate isomerase/epimerase family protein [Nostoc sp. SerVER01]
MKYGVNSFLWTVAFDESNLALLPQLKENGYDGIEIARFQFDDFDAAKIGAEIERNGLGCTVCSGLIGELNLVSDDSAVRQQTLSFLKQVVEITAELRANTLGGAFYSPIRYLPKRRRTVDEWQRAVEGLQSLGDTLVEYGVTLAVEPMNRFETYFLNTIADGVALCNAVNHPNVGLLLDIFHANIEEKNIATAIKSADRHLKHLQVSENDRGTPGSGHVAWDSIFAALRDIQYNHWMVIESFDFSNHEIVTEARIWRDLASTPEAIAYEGLAFLKRD